LYLGMIGSFQLKIRPAVVPGSFDKGDQAFIL
jgi:hypothetical protein